jgi:hypothetical protein
MSDQGSPEIVEPAIRRDCLWSMVPKAIYEVTRFIFLENSRSTRDVLICPESNPIRRLTASTQDEGSGGASFCGVR